jgi:hypothetical protein
MRRAIISALLLSTVAFPAFAANVSVPMDEVRIVTFKEPVATVFMGNPTIADVNMIDSRHAFVLGKTFGETNMIALGTGGRQIANDHVTVFGRRMGAVTLNRGNAQFNYTCTKAHCESQSVPGDDKNFFDATHNAVAQHEDQGVKSASNAAAAGNGQ